MKKKCYMCEKGELVVKKIPYVFHGKDLGKFVMEVCSTCNEQFLDEDTSKKIEVAAKKAKVWGLSRTTKVGKSGNSLDIRIPKDIAQYVGLKQGVQVVIHPEGKDRIIIERQ
jgi:succinylglutamate desuccinylase